MVLAKPGKFLILVIISFVLVGLLALLLVFTYLRSTRAITPKPAEITVGANQKEPVRFEFQSQIPNLAFRSKTGEEVDRTIGNLLNSLNISEIRSRSFYGEKHPQLNPNQETLANLIVVRFDFLPLSENKPEASQAVIQFFKYQDQNLYKIYAGLYKEGTLTIPIQIDTNLLTANNLAIDTYLSNLSLLALTLNLQTPPLTHEQLNEINQLHINQVSANNTPFFLIQQNDFFDFLDQVISSFAKPVSAQSCQPAGGVTCRRTTFQRRCVGGPNNGAVCTQPLDCPGGTCESISSCETLGTGGCYWHGVYLACFNSCDADPLAPDPCNVGTSCTLSSPPPPTPTPPPGTSCTTGTCQFGIANCGVNGWPNGTGTCTGGICCITGGTPPPTPVDPCPGDTCAGTCCNYICQTQPCIVTADCRADLVAKGILCMNTASGKYCVNPICPNNTVPGTLCGCSGGVACGAPCAGGCVANSTCRFTNAPGGFCAATGSNTYCIGDTGDNYHTYNPAFVTPKCTSGDTGNSMLQRVSNGATTGFTLAQIQSTCFQSTTAWWQAQDADITAGGSLVSPIPTTTCIDPTCRPRLIKAGLGGYPGVAVYQGTFDFDKGGGTGEVSNKNWLAETIYQGKRYDYSFFARQLPADVTLNEIGSAAVNGGDFNSGGTPSRGYVWYHRTGDLTINGNVNLVGSRKVVLLVESGNLNINGRINLQSPGQGFFMAIVGKAIDGTKGDILVDPSVSHPNQPELQGIFMADSEFKTGLGGTSQLHVKGSVTAWDGVSLQRDLAGNDNNTNPAELFEFDPTLVFTFPREFFRNRLVWKEVSP